MGFFDSIMQKMGFRRNEFLISKYEGLVNVIDSYEEEVQQLSDEELAQSANFFRERLANGETLDDILPEVFARVREVSVRTTGLRHFAEQMIGAMALNDGRIAEMKTGEGKTLVATLAVVLNAMTGKGVHVVTVNDYLAGRDAEWMGPIYKGMGLTVGVIKPQMDDEERYEAYRCDITYGTNSEFGFDYLRDNMAVSKAQQVQRGHEFCIVDEVDSILIDEARTPLIISGPSEDDTAPYRTADDVAKKMTKDIDFEVDEKENNLALTEAGITKAETILKAPQLFTDYANSAMAHKITQALKAHHLFKRDIHYVVKDGEIIIVDEFTGRLMEGRRYSDGLHQAIEAKEHVRIGRESQTLATITLQNYFRMYHKLAGMTGTALTEKDEFEEIYHLPVAVIPTHKPMIRKDNDDAIYRTELEKYNAAIDDACAAHAKGQPVLIGTTSIDHSELVSRLLRARKIPHNVLNAKVHDKEALIVAQAGRLGSVTVATNMAGRGTDIVLGGNAEYLAKEEFAKRELKLPENEAEYNGILEEFKKICADEHEKVLEAGGLCIIGTERHESRRIDNQLRGRSGRQGDPGESRFYISLQDDLIRLFGGDKINGIMQTLGLQEGERIEHPFLSKAIENAQKKVEQLHFEIRKQLLVYDNVMNQQREAVYNERREILEDSNVAERVQRIVEDTARAVLDKLFEEEESLRSDTKTVAIELSRLFWPGIAGGLEEFDGDYHGLREATERIVDDVSRSFEKKKAELGEEQAAEIFRYILLTTLDANWKEHLLDMDELRRGIGLRAIGQKDPLLEYQFESYNLFQQMLARVRESVTEFALKVSVATEENQNRRSKWTESHDDFNTLSSVENPAAAATAGKTETIVNANKTGRNDPCPCGSGKKYKNCCGK